MKATILIVDDEEAIRTLVKSILATEGYDLREAANAAGLRQLFTGPAPELVILDLNLPDGHGLTLLPELKQQWPECKVLILTGNGTVEAAERAYKIDEVFMQSKPFDMETLKALVALALSKKGAAR